MTGLTEAPEKVCVPVDWLQMDGVTTSSFPPNAAVDKYTFNFSGERGVIYIKSELESQTITKIFFQTSNVAVVKVEITNATGGVGGSILKAVTNDVSSMLRELIKMCLIVSSPLFRL